MKYLRRIFESSEDDKRYIEDCFLDISENPNFEVDDLLEVDFPKSLSNPMGMLIYKLHIELGKNLSLPGVNSNLFIATFGGKVETNLEFLRMKNEKLTELYNDIEVAIKRIKDRFDDYKCDIRIESNRREEIDITILVPK
jgi:hypothetical protein